MDLESKISSLSPGQSVLMSELNDIICTAERSGDGQTLRFVRTYPDGSFEVYKVTKF
jgi:hypothetical protein